MDCFPPANPSSSSGSSLVPNINGQKKKKKGGKRSNNNGVMKLSTDPQSVAARERRHRISDRFKILQSMVPGGTKLDTVSMLEEAINYVKFLKAQILFHQAIMNLDHDHHHSEPSPNILPAAGFALPLQQPSYLDANNFVPESVQRSVSLPVLPQAGSSYPGDQQGMHWDPFDNN